MIVCLHILYLEYDIEDVVEVDYTFMWYLWKFLFLHWKCNVF
jgi:hypothetical protein